MSHEQDDFAARFQRVVREHVSSTCLIIEQPCDNLLMLSFGDVHSAASRVQTGLCQRSVLPHQLVALVMERGSDLLISVLACLLHQCPFVLIDPSIPSARRNFILTDAQPALIISDQPLDSEVPLCSFNTLLGDSQSNENHSVPPEPDGTMYLIYTSGSTGTPKGVSVPYRAMYNRFRWMWNSYPWMSDDVQLWKTSVMFGDCIWEMLGGLLAGVPTAIASSTTVRDPFRLLRFIERARVTRLTLIPSFLSAMLKVFPTVGSGCLDSVRHIIVSGEVLSKALCKQYFSLPVRALLLNLYGSTETGNDATYYEVRSLADIDQTVPIGRPIAGMDYKIVDGELWLTGKGLAKEYWKNVPLTNEKFVIDEHDHRLYFKTGDRVSVCPRTGHLLYLGRMQDGQVKVRGARVELDEIEAIGLQHEFVEECGCFLNDSTGQVIACIRPSNPSVTESDMRHWFSTHLTEFQLPSVVILVTDALPRTGTGKLDRQQLKARFQTETAIAQSFSCDELDPVANQVIKLWCQTLNITKNDPTRSFTDLGGHSMMAMQLQYHLHHHFGIHVPIDQFFQCTTLTKLIDTVKNSTATTLVPSSPVSEEIEDRTFPLTLSQKSILIADELHPSSASAYNVVHALEILSDQIDVNQIREAIAGLIQRHAMLRTVFVRTDHGEVVQMVQPVRSTDVMLSEMPFEQCLSELNNIRFNCYQAEPLCRFYVCNKHQQQFLIIVLHHSIVDGWSLKILEQDLDRLLTCQPLEPVGMPFHQYARWEHDRNHQSDVLYWKKKLNNGDLPVCRLLYDHHESQPRSGRVQLIFPSDVTAAIRSFGQSQDATPFMVLLTTLQCLLARFTYSNDVAVGIVVANRTRADIDRTVGLFTNMLVARMDQISDEWTLIEFLSHVKQMVLEAFTHQSLPFSHLLSSLELVQRETHGNGLFQIAFAYQDIGDESPMHVLRRIPITNSVPPFELDLQAWIRPENFHIEAHFRANLFDAATIQGLLDAWLQLTRSALSEPLTMWRYWSMTDDQTSLSKIDVSTSWNKRENLCQLLYAQVQRTPTLLALEDGSHTLTYVQLWQEASQMACQIRRSLGNATRQCIAVGVERSIHLLKTIWAILMSDNYYVYVDPALPAERQRFILQDTHASLFITQSTSFDVQTNHLLTLDAPPDTDLNELAYILYTSGSTGTPKGVCTSHRAIATRMIHVDYHAIGPSTRVGQLSSFSFDMSTFEVFATLLNGGTLVIVPLDIVCSARALQELQLDVISPSTAVFHVLVQQESSADLFRTLKRIYFGGEKVNMKYLRRALQNSSACDPGKFVNVYGPTEATVFTLVYPVPARLPPSTLAIPIGRPLSDTSVYVVDQQDQLVPIGVPGELWIGGGGLSHGYHGQQELTAKKFIENPFAPGLVYRSGDFCRMRHDGTIEYLYRLDNQVKLRSQRLELGEIESHLLQHESITDAVVLLRDDLVEDEKSLVAYVQSSRSLDLVQVRHFLSQRLPSYMVPEHFIVMSQLPMTHVGKVDKKSLPKPGTCSSNSNHVFETLQQIYRDVLKRDPIDLNQSFFQLGGHSLSGMDVIARVYERLKIHLTLPNLFRAPSLADFTRQVEAQLHHQTQSTPLNLHRLPSSSSTVRRAPLTPAQRQFWFFWKMKPDSGFYNVPIALEINGSLNVIKLTQTLHTLVKKYSLLHTSFRSDSDGTLWQEELSEWTLSFIEEHVKNATELHDRLHSYATQPFDLTKGNVHRFVLVHLTDQHHFLLVCFHHIVCDGQSSSQFLEELFQLYSSDRIIDFEPAPCFLDYAHDQVATMTMDPEQLNRVVNSLRGFHTLHFDGIGKTDEEQPIHLVSHIASTMIDQKLADRLREMAMSENCTLHTILMTLFQCLLSVFSQNSSDLVLGSIMSTRSQPGTANLFGPLINTVPIRTQLSEESTTTFLDLLRTVRSSLDFAMEHQHVPFADVVQRLRLIDPNPSLYTYLPVFRVLFEMNTYQLFDRQHICADGSRWNSFNRPELLLPFTKSDIDLEVMDYGLKQPIQVTFNVNRALFGANFASQLLDCYQSAMEIVALDLRCSRQYLWQRIRSVRQPSPTQVLGDLFRRQVETRPNHCALIDGDQRWTYAELYQRAYAVAQYLLQNGVTPGQVIALWMSRSAFLIASMLGVLMAGGTYLYIDPDLPELRVRRLLQDADVRLIIGSHSPTSTALLAEYHWVIEASITMCPGTETLPIVQPSDYCYLIYTSGSTGEPKGVKIQHQAVARRIRLPVETPSTAVIAQVTSCSFDVYILEVYGALLNGATLVIMNRNLIFQPKQLAQYILTQSITHMFLPTPIFNVLAEYEPHAFSTMDCVLFAGDRANAKLIRQVLQTDAPPKHLINAYGPTEITCIATWYEITTSMLSSLHDHDSIPIGQALEDTPLYIVDPLSLELITDEVQEGELIIGGYGVCDGYINKPHETEMRFLSDRYGHSGGKVYRTGDRVRRDQQGNLHFLGRFDTQVKINGYRIEPLEIEHVLQAYPTVVEASVTIRDDLVPQTRSIVAYIRPKEQSEADICQYLSDRLPSYMVPAFIMPVDTMPLSPSGGKRDWKQLPSPIVQSTDSVEKKVQTAWNEVLGRSNTERTFHLDDDFFACGGTSINILQLHTKLEALFNCRLDVLALFEHRTVAQQINWLAGFQPTIQKIDHPLPPVVSSQGVAIIGMSARYGPLETLPDLWMALRQGRNCCTNISRDQLLRDYPAMKELIDKNPNYVHAGCMMNRAECFDHAFFDMTKRDADITDPQHRILLEATYEALEDAGLVPDSYTGTIGMFAAVYRNTYADCYQLLRANPYDVYDETKARMGITNFDSATVMRAEIGNMVDGAPTMISFKLGLNGPSMAIQTACSSSGTALHMALRSLEAGDCTVAIVAGVCINFPLGLGYNYQPGMIMSKTGVCRSFDERADGVVGGDGAGVVILMKVNEALTKGYGIRAVIRGHAINNDGRQKNSYSTTSPDRQADCMRQALAMAQIQQPQHEIDYIEAHGPGTPIGDLLEVQALIKAYAGDSNNSKPIHLSSVKTNLGHTAHAATLASLIKVVLALNAGEMPPTANFRQLNANIARLQPPFVIDTRPVPWPSAYDLGRPRRAAINALGQGGTNTHFIIEERPVVVTEPILCERSRIFLLSAKTTEALVQMKERFSSYLTTAASSSWTNISFTLACGRIHYGQRDALVASSIADLQRKINSSTRVHRNASSKKPRLVFVFPGQGSQYQGMARHLYDHFPQTCAPLIDKCLEILRRHNSELASTVRACLLDQHDALDRYAQVLLFITEYALVALLFALNIRPDYLLGHSCGEFVAACLAGAMSLETALTVLAQRCLMMLDSPASAMLAVRINPTQDDPKHLAQIHDVDVAVLNSSSQVIYAGSIDNIQRMEQELRRKGIQVKLLKTSAGFHSRCMKPICEQIKPMFSRIQLQEPTIPIVSTVLGRLVQPGEMARPTYWSDQLCQPVLFAPALDSMKIDQLVDDDPSTIFMSVGPGKALISLLAQAFPRSSVVHAPLLPNDDAALDVALGELWMNQVSINWLPYFERDQCTRISLPTYPFARTVCVAENRCSAIDTAKTKPSPPWKMATKHFSKAQIVRSASDVTDQTELFLGSQSSLLVQTLYYEALTAGLLSSTESLACYIPSDYVTSSLVLTLEDLLLGKIDTNQSCSTVSELLAALRDHSFPTTGPSTVFSMALLGHVLGVIYETSFEALVQERLVRPFGLKQTRVAWSRSNEALYPANGWWTSIEDLQKLIAIPSDQPMGKAFQTALINPHPSMTGVEQIIISMDENDPHRPLILIRDQPAEQLSIDYRQDVEACLISLLGHPIPVKDDLADPSFQQLGIDSLQAITFVELLSKKFNTELPMEILGDYPTVSALSRRLQQLNGSMATSQNSEVCHRYVLNSAAGIPLVYEAHPHHRSVCSLMKYIAEHREELLEDFHHCGALLFRGFLVETAEEFGDVIELFAGKDRIFHDYRDGISPRTRITEKVFTSTDYPKQYDMALHNELSYSKTMPSLIFFFCHTPPGKDGGGETPIADSAAIYQAIDRRTRDEFSEKGLLYVTNMPSRTNSMIGKSWQETYQTESKVDVERFLREQAIEFEWLPKDVLRTYRRASAVRQHASSSMTTWCNHAHLFHPSDLPATTRQALEKRYRPLEMPKNCFFGNGDPIPETMLAEIRQVLKDHEVHWSWCKGDVLILDNIRIAHGRASFSDPQRRIFASMC